MALTGVGRLSTLKPMIPEDTSSSQGMQRFDVQTLVRRACGGDRNAFGVLYEKYRGFVLGSFLRVGAGGEEAWDLTHQTFLHAWRGLDTLDLAKPVKFGSWLRTIARNVLKKKWMKEERASVLPACLDGFPDIVDPGQEVGALASSADEDYSALYACLDALSIENRCLVLLRTVRGLSFRAMGSLVGAAEATLRYKLRGALEQLRDCLRQKGVMGV